MRFRYNLFLAVLGFLFQPETHAQNIVKWNKDEGVRDVHFHAEEDKVHVFYSLSGEGDYEVSLRLSDDGGRNFSIMPKSTSGAVGASVVPGNNKWIIWDVIQDRGSPLEGDNFVFEILARRPDRKKWYVRIGSGVVTLFVGGRLLPDSRVPTIDRLKIGAVTLLVNGLIWAATGITVESSGQSLLPAHLVVEEKTFREPSGNRALDGGEKGSLHLKVGNKGLGPAEVSIRLIPLGTVDGLEFTRLQRVGKLKPGEFRIVEIPLQASMEIPGGKREIRVEITEELNRDSLPFTLRFRTRSAVGRAGPALSIKEKPGTSMWGQDQNTGEVLTVHPGSSDKEWNKSVAQAGRFEIDEIPQGSTTRREQGLAVIIGIEKYRYTSPAKYKLRDATLFYQYTRDVLGIPEERIALRTDGDATKAEFDYIFEPKGTPNDGWLKKRLRVSEETAEIDLFVYLAGHGSPDWSTGKPYLIPYDVRPGQATNGISLHHLFQVLNDLETRSVTVFLESCFSGVSGYQGNDELRQLVMNINPVIPVIDRPIVGPRMVVITATSGDRPSSNRDDLGHGIFTYFLLKGLGGSADDNDDKAVTVQELYRYILKEVPAKALEAPLDREQVPEMWPSIDRIGLKAQRILVQYR